jgi:hypothetical protein
MTCWKAFCSAPLQTAITDTLPETLPPPDPDEALLELELERLPQPTAMAATTAMLSYRCVGLFMVFVLLGRRAARGDGLALG